MERLIMETNESNKLIAEFMGAKTNGASTIAKDGSCTQMYELEIHGIFGKIKYYDKPTKIGVWPIEGLKFHTSWDWLMPVVKKIYNYSLGFGNSCLNIEIDYVYKACIEFIQWHTNNPNHENAK